MVDPTPWPETWSQPAACTSNLASLRGGNIWLAPGGAGSSCYPPGDVEGTFYAPQPTQCPQGFTAGESNSYIDSRPGWTLYDCCSSGWKWTTYKGSLDHLVCASFFTTETVIPVWDWNSGTLQPVGTAPTFSSRTAFAQVIHVAYFPANSASDRTGLAAATPTSTSSQATEASPGPNLGVGAIAGIGVAVGLLFLSLFFAAAYIVMRKKRRRRAAQARLEKLEVERHGTGYPEVNAVFGPTRRVGELPVPQPDPVELEGALPRAELAAAPVPPPPPSQAKKSG